MGSMNGQRKFNNATISAEHEIKRYIKILRRRKWTILFSSLIVFIIWVGYVLLFQSRPIYTASVLLSLEDRRSVSAVAELGRGERVSSKASFLMTNRLLGQVVEELQLNISMRTEDLKRSQLFKYVKTSKESVPGEYWITKSGAQYELHYTNKELSGIPEESKIKDSLLTVFSPEDTVRVHNIEFLINHDYVKGLKFKELRFAIKVFSAAIESLKKIVSYTLDRSRTMMTISVNHYSPHAAAIIANTLAKRFVELNLQLTRHKSDQVMVILENQLRVAKAELDEATRKLRAFQERYPWVRLSSDARMQIMNIATLEEAEQTLRTKIADLQTLRQRIETPGISLEEQLSLTNELITFLSSRSELEGDRLGYPLAAAFSAEFTKLTTEREELLASYAPTHPIVKENEEKIYTLIEKVKEGARDYARKLQMQLDTTVKKLEEERNKLNKLPSTSLQYAELNRVHELKQRVYSTVLTRYNQNKIEREVEVSDVFIVDPATPPPERDAYTELIIKSLMGLIFALGVGIGVAVIVELFDKTAENVEELQEMLDIPVVGEIPMIKVEADDEENFEELKGKRDPKLITLDYSPTLASESYRDLRTKVLFMNQNENLSSLMVTSLRPDEGKSLTTANLSITVAQQKISTLLIDGDLRRGVLHNTFGNKKTPGLSDFLISSATVDFDNLSKLIQPTFIPNLFLITCGSPIPNPTEMLGGERLIAFLNLLRSRFGMVIMDTPPIQASSDAAILARYFDGVLTVVKAGSTNIEQLQQKLNEYPYLREKVIGAVLNMVNVNVKKTQYQYSYYNY